MFFLIADIFFLIIRLVVVQDDFNDFHGVVPDLFNLPLSAFKRFSSLVFLFLSESISILKFVFFEIVVEIAE